MRSRHLAILGLLSLHPLIGSEEPAENAKVHRWKSEVLTGTRLEKPPEPHSIFDLFTLTHEWEGIEDTRLRIWEGAGMWPGRFPVIAQLCDRDGAVLSAEVLELPAARPLRCWAFHRMGSHLVVNIECQHRHHPETGIYPFRVTMANKVVSGGPVISSEVLTDAHKLLPDLIGAGEESKKAEQGVAPQSATRSESDSEGGNKPQPESEPRPR